MAGIIPLVYLTNINVRSSGQISLLPFLSSPLSLLYTLQFDIGKRLFCPSEPYSANTSICLFCEKKSVAKAKVFFLLIQSAFFPRPRHPPQSFSFIFTGFNDHNYSNGFGGFASQWLQAPNQSNLGRKSWTWSSWGKKSIFPWKSHAVQLARVSPLLETPSLTSSHPSPGRWFLGNTIGSIYEIWAGWAGAG